ncbi:FAD-dependent monooxygenase [Parasphingorhabdus sp. DH2-15]|uniref:FAD-dependent monooxygenase n=1 Tax=Parasphingorhabdus sp. DH2-15 TaxID=3444112 RepID=UPI003F685E28
MQINAIITGGGIGGLTAALCLHHFGHSARILEQAKTIKEVGAGIQISPNAMHILRALGLDKAVIAKGFLPKASQMRTGREGREIMTSSMADYPAIFGAPYVHIHRADLINVLREAVEERLPGSLQTDCAVSSYGQDKASAWPSLADGSHIDGDILIGADGIKSAIRQQMHGDDRPRFTGNVAWRAVVPVENLGRHVPPPNATVWLGAGKHAVTYLLRGGALANFVGVVERSDWREEGWTIQGSRRDALADFAGWHPIITNIIDKADAHYRWALFDRAPLNQWSDGRVTLLGDACHPMLPFMAQGAAQAMEDAYVLARTLGEQSDIETALQQYCRTRLPRTKKVQAQAQSNMRLFHQGPGPARLIRHGPLWLAGKAHSKLAGNALAWLYGHNVTA